MTQSLATNQNAGPATLLGQGRSGKVYLLRSLSEIEPDIAVKVFFSESLTKLVQYMLMGAPNPYIWSEDAIKCAALRRNILAVLVKFWFKDALSVSMVHGSEWNNTHRAYALHCSFVSGRAPLLKQPFQTAPNEEIGELVSTIMQPLQKRLIESGFDGLVWQAGLGNPVAANNFLRCEHNGQASWSWIDLESGVPALFPLNPISLLRFYIPMSLKHRRALFDDVDVKKLQLYLEGTREALIEALGVEQFNQLCSLASELEDCQTRWRAIPRHQRAIRYRFAKGRLSEAQVEWYNRRPIRWYAREARNALATGFPRLAKKIKTGIKWLCAVNVGTILRNSVRAVLSQEYRARVAQDHVKSRISSWHSRGQISQGQKDLLVDSLESEESSSYLTDFGMHIVIKPFIKGFQFGVVLPLMAAGVLGPLVGGGLIVMGGMLGRTAYTLYRTAQAKMCGYKLPWTALFVGTLPVIGNGAYPMQILYSSAGENAKIAQFIVYDIITQFGEHLPIWGGQDTQTEHVFNGLGGIIAQPKLMAR